MHSLYNIPTWPPPVCVCILLHSVQEIGVGGTCAWRLCVTDPSMAYTVVLEVSNQVGLHVINVCMFPVDMLSYCYRHVVI